MTTQPDFANEFLARVYSPLVEQGLITLPETYTCSRMETCKELKRNPQQFKYRCIDRLLSSICPGENN